MAITVKHLKVSAIPDSGDDTLIEPSDWNADHELTGTVPVANGGTGAATLTGYVKGNGTSAMTASSTIPNTAITGLGTASTKDAGSANGVATLDSGGKVPVSELPAAVLGALSYQGTWNASTNTPTLASSTGTKGYYYVVSVAGSTDLDGITDWVVGDWAVFNGSVWQQIDNTDAVTSVNGQVGTVVLGYADVGAFPATATTGTGNVVLATNPTISSPNIDVVDFDTTYATTLTAGQLGWDGNNTLALGMAGGNVIQHIGEDSFFYIKASSAITKGQLVMFTGAVGASGVLTGAPSTGVTNPQYIMGVAAESIALNGFGLIQWFGEVTGINTNGFNEGDVLYYDSAVTGGLTNVYPTSGIIVTVAAVAKKSAGGGVLAIRVSATDRITASTGISVSQNGTGTTVTNTAPDQTVSIASGTGISATGTYPAFTVTNTGVTSAVAGTGISVSGSTGAVTVTNTAPDQTVVLTAGTGISTSGTYPSFTVTNTAPDQTVSLTGGTGISTSGTYPNFTITNTSPSSGGTVTAVSVTSANGFTGTSSGGATPALTLTTSITGMLKGNGTAISAGTAGTDYVAPATATSFTAQQYFGNVALTDGATISWAANTAQVATFTFVSSNRTMGAPTGLVSGAYYGLAVIQNGGSNTLTWNSVFKWAGGTAPTLSTAAGAKDYFVFRTDGTNMYEQGRSLGVA